MFSPNSLLPLDLEKYLVLFSLDAGDRNPCVVRWVGIGVGVGVKFSIGLGVRVSIRVGISVGIRVGVEVRVKISVGVRAGVKVSIQVSTEVSPGVRGRVRWCVCSRQYGVFLHLYLGSTSLTHPSSSLFFLFTQREFLNQER